MKRKKKKRWIISLICAVWITLGVPLAPIYADSPEILLNPGFEQDIDHWQAAVNGTLLALESYDGVTPQAGNYFMHMHNRYGYADSPMQRIENQLNHYGPGSYQMGAYMRLSPDSTASSIRARVVIRLISTDKSWGSAQHPGNYWYTTSEVTINKTSWTLVQSTVDITWSQDLERADFYFMNNTEDPAVDLCVDNANLIRTDYTGDPYVFSTTATGAPSGPTSEISQDPSDSSAPEESNNASDVSAKPWGIGWILLIVLGLILFAGTGVVLIWNLRRKKDLGVH